MGIASPPRNWCPLCKDNLASYKKPRFFVFADELPRSAYGKVLKRQLAEQYSGLAEGVGGF